MRRLLQLVMIAALLSGSDAFAAAMMPCCAPAVVAGMPAEMEMPSAVSASPNCHDAVSAQMPSDGSMSLQAAPMIQCPRAVANLQASTEWKSSEQAESFSPLQIAAHLPAKHSAMSPLQHSISYESQRNDSSVTNNVKSLPLRV